MELLHQISRVDAQLPMSRGTFGTGFKANLKVSNLLDSIFKGVRIQLCCPNRSSDLKRMTYISRWMHASAMHIWKQLGTTG